MQLPGFQTMTGTIEERHSHPVLPAVIRMAAIVVIATALLPRAAAGQDLINRRDQARSAFLATPEGTFRHYCAHCHGDDAMGSGRLWASDLSPKPADLTVLRDKQYVLSVIRKGSEAQGKSNLCPPWERTISPLNVERLAEYILSLGGEVSGPPPEPASPAAEPFPWLPLVLILAEAAVLWWMLRRKREVSNALP